MLVTLDIHLIGTTVLEVIVSHFMSLFIHIMSKHVSDLLMMIQVINKYIWSTHAHTYTHGIRRSQRRALVEVPHEKT